MSDDLAGLIIIAAISVPIGLTGGILLRKKRPEWCKSIVKDCHRRRWRLFALGAFLFLGLSVISFVQGRCYFGVFFLVGFCLEVFGIVRYGLKTLTPEQEAQIDASDPTRLWPLNFWKNTKVGEQGSPRLTDTRSSD